MRLSAFFGSRGIEPVLVEDLVQEAFITLWEKRAYVVEGKEGGFLFGIARKLLLARWREIGMKDRIPNLMRQLSSALAGNPAQHRPDTVAMAEEQVKLVEDAIDCLPPRQRELMRLVYLQGYTRAEAARRMGVIRQTVHEYEKRAVKKLGAILQAGQPRALKSSSSPQSASRAPISDIP